MCDYTAPTSNPPCFIQRFPISTLRSVTVPPGGSDQVVTCYASGTLFATVAGFPGTTSSLCGGNASSGFDVTNDTTSAFNSQSGNASVFGLTSNGTQSGSWEVPTQTFLQRRGQSGTYSLRVGQNIASQARQPDPTTGTRCLAGAGTVAVQHVANFYCVAFPNQ